MRMADLEAILASDLPTIERMTALVIGSYINEINIEAWPSVDTIAARGGMSRNSALRSIRALHEKGWLSITRRFSKSTKYQIHHVSTSSLSQALVQHRGALTETSAAQRLVPDRCSSSLSQSTLMCSDRDSNSPVNSPSEQSSFLPDDSDIKIDTSKLPTKYGFPADHRWSEFYEAYGNKFGKNKAMAAWCKLSIADRALALEAVGPYVKSTPPGGTIRKYPATWINQRCWEDEGVAGEGEHDRLINDFVANGCQS